MNKRLAIAAVLAAVFVFAPAASAQKQPSKEDQFREIAKLSNAKSDDDKEKAYKMGVDYLAKYGTEESDNTKKVRDFVGKYRKFKFFNAAEGSKPDEAYTLGRAILVDEPANVTVMMNMPLVAYRHAEKGVDAALAAEMSGHSRKAVELIEAGKVTDNKYDPFTDRATALGWMHFLDGFFMQGTDKKGAAASFYRSAEASKAGGPSTMAYIGLAGYYESLYEALAADFNAKRNSMSDAEFKAATERSEKIVDAMLDAYARGVKSAEAEKHPAAASWRQRFEQVYEYRRKSKDGMSEYLATIDKSPIPEPSKL